MYVPLIDGKCIPGDGVKTGVINSWDKGDGKKCTNVGLGDCRHMGSLPSYFFTNMGDCRHVFLETWGTAVIIFKKHDGGPTSL